MADISQITLPDNDVYYIKDATARDDIANLSAAMPTKTSDLINDSGFITSYTETDPTVPAWAKATSKPSYTAAEVGAQPTLVSGTNIKTINNESLLGSGNITISGGSSLTVTRYTGTFATGYWFSESGGGYSQTMQITGAYNAQNIDASIDLDTSGMTASTADTLQENWSEIGRITLTSSGLTAYCYDTAPTVALPFILTVTR